jgi:hypothetical protein
VSGSRWPVRLALLMAAGGALSFGFALLDFGSGRQSGDTHVVLDVVGGGEGGRHAVVGRYTPASGSGGVTAIWIVSSAPPEKGSRRPLEGEPVAVWRESVPRLTWQGSQLRLIGRYERVRRASGRVSECFAHSSREWDLCIDPEQVVFASFPR